MKFQPGNKHGKGRPRGSGLVQICKDYAQAKGWQKLIDLAEGKGYKVGTLNGKVVEIGPSLELQFEALKLCLAYGHGKPTEHVDFTTGGDTLADALRSALHRRRSSSGDAGGGPDQA